MYRAHANPKAFGKATPKPAAQSDQYEAVLQRARRRFDQAVAAEQKIREEALLDLKFLAGEQWEEKVKTDRQRGPSPRPCLVFNKVLPPVTQLGNQARQNKPAIKVSPVDSAGDPDTAKVLQGMIRHIEYDSDADQAYDTALFYAAGCGMGYWRYTSEYSDNESFDQDLKTVTVDDPFSVYLDCFARKPDRSDMKWAFVVERFPNDAYQARFGEDTPDLSLEFSRELENNGWRDGDSKQVAEYWEVETTEKTLRMRKAEDGTLHKVYLEDENPEELNQMEWELDDEGKPKERIVQIPEVWQYIINGAQVLEAPTKWDGSTIPIVMVTGLEMIIRGEQKRFSMTRFARDPQQLLNFYKTMEAETISLAPKPKYVGAVGQFKTKRMDWARANTDNAAFLEYDPIEVGGKFAPEPQWRTFDPPVQALAIGAAAAADDIKSSTGYFDPSLGINKSDQSGVAIGKLQRQGDVSNFHFMDNLARALKRGGRILVELIPKKYDTAREVRVIGEDQKQRIVKVNIPFEDENGKTYHHKLDLGKYDVTVEQGPSYTTARQEVRDTLVALSQGNPQVMQLSGDIFFENSDFPGADRLAKRWKKSLPPNLQGDDEENPDIPQAIQAQMQQMQQATQALQAENQQLVQLLKGKLLEIDSKERMNTENNQMRLQVAQTTSKSSAMNKLAELDHGAVKHQLDLRAQLEHTQLTVAADVAQQERELEEAEAQRQHDQQMQQLEQAHQQRLQSLRQPPQGTQQAQPPEQPQSLPSAA